MQNFRNVYICGSPFVMSRTDAQNGLDMVFKDFWPKLHVSCVFFSQLIEFYTV
jgi:hypothetical protein